MTHSEVIDSLRALQGDALPAGVVEGVLEHLASCSDCWTALAAFAGPGDAARMEALFGCEAIREDLFAMVDLPPAVLAREHRAAARHLGWCRACRTRFAEMIAVERDLTARPSWTDVVGTAGERAREAVGRLVVHLGNAVAGIRVVPDGFVLGPAVATAGVRGEPAVHEHVTPSLAQSTRFPLGETGVTAEIGIESADDARAGLSLRLTTTSAGPVSIQLREVRSDDEVLIARHTLHSDEPVYIRGLWPASFIVVLHEPSDARRYRVRLDIGPAV